MSALASAASKKAVRSPFPSFFMGGFESSTPVLSDGRRLDLVAASQHDRQAATDYDLMLTAGVRTVRESVRWPMVDQGGRLRLREVRRLARLLRERQMVGIWDLMHYGFPEGVDPYSPAFVDRFASYAGAVAGLLSAEAPGGGWYTPINEISFMSHAAGDIGLFYPFSRGRGWDLKLQLVRAAVAAMEAILREDPLARFVQVDPLIHLVPGTSGQEEAARVRDFNERIVFEGWRMLRGDVAPELGGRPEFLSVAGLNLYRLCQWELDNEGSFLAPQDPRWTPLNRMLADAWGRLGCPLIIGETGELGPHRAAWLRYLLDEVEIARSAGVPVLGVCWYPIVSSPDWQDPTTVFTGGWWDSVPRGRRLVRVPYAPVLEVAAEERQRLGETTEPASVAAEGTPSRGPWPSGSPTPSRGPWPSGSPTPSGGPSPSGPGPSAPPEPAVPPELAVEHPPLEFSRARGRRLPESWERALLAAGEELSVSVYTFAPGRSVGVRAFASCETVLYVVEGQVNVTGWREGQLVRAGSVTLIPKGRAFGVHNPGPKAASVLQVMAPPAWSADFQGPERAPRPQRRP